MAQSTKNPDRSRQVRHRVSFGLRMIIISFRRLWTAVFEQLYYGWSIHVRKTDNFFFKILQKLTTDILWNCSHAKFITSFYRYSCWVHWTIETCMLIWLHDTSSCQSWYWMETRKVRVHMAYGVRMTSIHHVSWQLLWSIRNMKELFIFFHCMEREWDGRMTNSGSIPTNWKHLS